MLSDIMVGQHQVLYSESSMLMESAEQDCMSKVASRYCTAPCSTSAMASVSFR
jgi:hypothetical protein